LRSPKGELATPAWMRPHWLLVHPTHLRAE
jgi:hypothetical protein